MNFLCFFQLYQAPGEPSRNYSAAVAAAISAIAASFRPLRQVATEPDLRNQLGLPDPSDSAASKASSTARVATVSVDRPRWSD